MPRTLKELFIELKDDITESILDIPRIFRKFIDFLKRVKAIAKAFPKMKRRKKTATLRRVGAWYYRTREDIFRLYCMIYNRFTYYQRRALLIMFPDYYMLWDYLKLWRDIFINYIVEKIFNFLIYKFYQTIGKFFIFPLILLKRKIIRLIHKFLYNLLVYDYKKKGYFRKKLYKIYKLII